MHGVAQLARGGRNGLGPWHEHRQVEFAQVKEPHLCAVVTGAV
jgi:hypothetical protein